MCPFLLEDDCSCIGCERSLLCDIVVHNMLIELVQQFLLLNVLLQKVGPSERLQLFGLDIDWLLEELL